MRLRYRVAGGGAVKWILQPYRPEVSLKHAFDEAVLKVETETGLAVLRRVRSSSWVRPDRSANPPSTSSQAQMAP